jgi:hypothetical protein
MNLPGSFQVGLAKRLLEEYPWPRFEPHPEWATWRLIGQRDEYQVPYAAGIPGGVRIIYVPSAEAVAVHHLESDRKYRGIYFDPVSGERKDLGSLRPDTAGSWNSPEPPGPGPDWVLILETSR